MHIVLDLDETLINSSSTQTKEDSFTILVGGQTYYVSKRPYLNEFLTFAFRNFESVSIWTAATLEYAYRIVRNILSPEQYKALAFLKTRQHLGTKGDGTYYKPLNSIFTDPKAIAMGITSKNTIMIDDRKDVLHANPGNGVIIPPYTRDQSDYYLRELIVVLQGMLSYGMTTEGFQTCLELKTILGETTTTTKKASIGVRSKVPTKSSVLSTPLAKVITKATAGPHTLVHATKTPTGAAKATTKLTTKAHAPTRATVTTTTATVTPLSKAITKTMHTKSIFMEPTKTKARSQ